MASSLVRLGSVAFQGHEVPEHINFGTKQRLAKHVLIGGRRIVDAMGPDACDPRWSGRFRGPSALSRARAIERMARQGGQVGLSWGGISYRVVIEEFEADYRRSNDIPYKIECFVVDDGLGGGDAGTPLDSLIGSDLGGAVGLMGGLFSAGPAGALGALSGAISTAGDLVDLPLGALAPLQGLAYAAVDALDVAVGVADLAIKAGLVPDPALLPGEGFAAALTGQSAALEAQDALLLARGLTGRVAANLATSAG